MWHYKLLFFNTVAWTHKFCFLTSATQKLLYCMKYVWVFSRLSQRSPLFKNTQTSPTYTQFLTTLLEELHFKNEDLESLTRIFRMDWQLEWSVIFKLLCLKTKLVNHGFNFQHFVSVYRNYRLYQLEQKMCEANFKVKKYVWYGNECHHFVTYSKC